jgi:hypothetical protein
MYKSARRLKSDKFHRLQKPAGDVFLRSRETRFHRHVDLRGERVERRQN